jgi:outer membrane receptor protein involved in Fe transport
MQKGVRLKGRALVIGLLAGGMVFASATAQAAPRTLDIREASMATALADLARQARVDLLFDRQLVRGLVARPIRGRVSAEAALGKLLAGSGVGYRVTPDGAFVLFAIPAARPATEAGDGAIAELLVVGRRTQNVDIRRTENDIQPYRIMGRREIEASGRSNLDDVLRARESANTSAGSPTLNGETRSVVDLRGFGQASTLVLLDGRRMPIVPSSVGDFLQADINGVPLGAIERIEVLTTTAGGIYGPGALGGVVNVVLRRDYRGADLTAHAGITDRGDADEARLEARLGFTPDHGKTDVMLFLAESRAAPLRVGQRAYLERASRLAFTNDPAGYGAALPVRNGISIASRGGDLTLDPQYGGAALGARTTFLPIGFSGSRAEAGAQLVANAGRLPFDLTDDLAGKRGDLNMGAHVTSGLLNVRRRVGSRVEIFFDGLYSRNRGHLVDAFTTTGYPLAAANPGNPFGQDVNLSFPQGVLRRDLSSRLDVGRGAVGAIADLPGDWKGSADITIARTTLRSRSLGTEAGLTGAISFRPSPGKPVVDLFGDWGAVLAALPFYAEQDSSETAFRATSRDFALRLAGPLMKLPGGPLTVTLVAQDREDRIADSILDFSPIQLPVEGRTQRVRSGYAEFRAPVTTSDSAMPLLRDIEVQLAVRHDRYRQQGQTAVLAIGPTDRFSVNSNGTTFTAGARVSPTRALMLRGSVATGERPPTLTDLQSLSSDFIIISGPPDPRRGGRPLSTEAPFDVLLGGSLRVGPARARSVTLGAVLNPDGRKGPRLSLDYSRIVVSHEPMFLSADPAALLAAEAEYPDRVVRRPATAADLAAGFTVGPVVRLDFASDNSGRTVVEAVDARLDWRLPNMNIGDLRLYGAATWQPTFRQKDFALGVVNHTNKFDGPLEWRGNAGVEWTLGPTVVDLNAQYYGSYQVSYARSAPASNASLVRSQGTDRIPAQVYLDVSAQRRLILSNGPGPFSAVDARLSVLNLLDHAPPTVASDSTLGFSKYGDPRRRRVMLTLATQF